MRRPWVDTTRSTRIAVNDCFKGPRGHSSLREQSSNGLVLKVGNQFEANIQSRCCDGQPLCSDSRLQQHFYIWPLRDRHQLNIGERHPPALMTTNLFTRELIQVVSDWQRKPNDRKQRHKRAVALQEHCIKLPSKYRQTSLTCYRQMSLDKQGVWKLLDVQSLDEQVSSWTLDMGVAKTLLGGVPQADTCLRELIFAIFPRSEQVVVNLKTLLDEEKFQQAAEAHKAEIDFFSEGLGKYKNDQSEIVLNVGELVEADIWSFGGRSSSFEGLVRRAFLYSYSRKPMHEQEFEAFRAETSEMESQAGARWLTHESTKSVLMRVRPQADVLRAIKEQQERLRREADVEVRGAATSE